MRASDLIGRDVLGYDGEPAAVVSDVRCVQGGPLRRANAAFRVEALLVSAHHTGSALGYDSRKQGPRSIRVVVGWLHRSMRVVSWADVVDEGPPVRLRR